MFGFAEIRSGTAYIASKPGVIGLTRQLTFEYGARGIRVNTICPGATGDPTRNGETNDRAFTRHGSSKVPGAPVVLYLHTLTNGVLVAGDNSKMSILEKLARLALEN